MRLPTAGSRARPPTVNRWGAGSARGITSVDVAGIATDYCVRATAADAVRAGFATSVLLGLTAGVAAATTRAALGELRDIGVELTGNTAGLRDKELGLG